MNHLIAQGLQEPPALVSPLPPWVWLALFGTTALASISLATYWSITRRDPIPIMGCIGAAICALNEPIFDVLGKIVYAENNVMAYSAFGRDIPVFLVIGYIAWVGLVPYVIARGMQAGWSPKRLYLISIAGVMSVWGVEAINLLIHGWSYYGEPPLKFFGGVAAMASVPLAGAFLIYTFGFSAHGWRRWAAGLFIPMFALPMLFAGTGWPLYLALHTDLPPIMDYLAVAALILLIVIANVTIVKLTVTWREFVHHHVVRDLVITEKPDTAGSTAPGPTPGDVVNAGSKLG